jgi:hypothetical protein
MYLFVIISPPNCAQVPLVTGLYFTTWQHLVLQVEVCQCLIVWTAIHATHTGGQIYAGLFQRSGGDTCNVCLATRHFCLDVKCYHPRQLSVSKMLRISALLLCAFIQRGTVVYSTILLSVVLPFCCSPVGSTRYVQYYTVVLPYWQYYYCYSLAKCRWDHQS